METTRESGLTIVQLRPAMLRAELTAYEQKYGMPSVDFYARYCDGEFPEAPYAPDFFDWAGLCHMALHEPELRDRFERA
jgi:hypothetical protein